MLIRSLSISQCSNAYVRCLCAALMCATYHHWNGTMTILGAALIRSIGCFAYKLNILNPRILEPTYFAAATESLQIPASYTLAIYIYNGLGSTGGVSMPVLPGVMIVDDKCFSPNIVLRIHKLSSICKL